MDERRRERKGRREEEERMGEMERQRRDKKELVHCMVWFSNWLLQIILAVHSTDKNFG